MLERFKDDLRAVLDRLKAEGKLERTGNAAVVRMLAERGVQTNAVSVGRWRAQLGYHSGPTRNRQPAAPAAEPAQPTGDRTVVGPGNVTIVLGAPGRYEIVVHKKEE